MEFVDKLLQKTDYLEQLKKLELLEQNREFCRHGLAHLLDTARIAWIRCQELYDRREEVGSSEVCQKREVVYLAALLHDLGRIQEYEDGMPHHEASVVVAKRLLNEIGYPEEKKALVIAAVAGHRSSEHTQEIKRNFYEKQLSDLLRWADKQSRNCFYCKAQQSCNWPEEKRNLTISY